MVLRFRSNLLYQKFVRISTSVPRALKRLCAKHRASAEAEVRENALHTTTMFSKGCGVQKCKCGLGFAKQFSGERIRKTETTVFEIRQGFWISPARRRGLGRNLRGLPFGFLAGRALIKKDTQH